MIQTGQLTGAGRICPACEEAFYPNRKDMKFCSPRCRKNNYSRKDRKENLRNSQYSPAKWRENMDLFDRHRCLVTFVNKQVTQEQKDHVLRDIIDVAENGHGQLWTILTSKAFKTPNRHREYLFQGCDSRGETIAQMANAYTWKTWGCSLEDALVKQ